MDSLEINLDKTESDRICELIAGYVSKFKKFDSIDCIYYTAYQHTYNGIPGKPIIALTLVTTNVDNEILRSEVDNINNGEGVKFNVLDANKNVIETLVTDNNGEAISKELTPGTYYYKEVEVPSPYILDTTEYKFEVVAGGELVAVKVVNHKAYGKLEITKYDTNQKVLSGVKFNILDENDNVVDTIVTDANGVATSKDLVIGKYFYQEIEAPNNVIMDQNKYEFVLSDNGQVIKKTVKNLRNGKPEKVYDEEEFEKLYGKIVSYTKKDKIVMEDIKRIARDKCGGRLLLQPGNEFRNPSPFYYKCGLRSTTKDGADEILAYLNNGTPFKSGSSAPMYLPIE